MAAKPVDPRARLEQWRQQQLDRHDPVAFAVLDALQARAARAQGSVRTLLEQRLCERVAAYASALPRASRRGASAAPQRAAPLADLVAELASRPRVLSTPDAPADTSPAPAAWPALPAIGEFRALWATVRSRSQVRQTLAAAPSDGGPLNSAVLVHRAITLMGETSPGYLTHFLAYVDNLSWLEPLQPRNGTPPRDVGRMPKPRRARPAKS
ncbi:DUF2894 domain-containing protein [Stenotrophomonas sp.]|uniref:DUF2894 domain-containing protein n=1 Tax=Stenotrophomonas sp. TaxID=69392 RepID=UPI0028962C4D|nr:DUF2894 domain-containing protein [Stenotrophomonas sp.]